MTILQKMLVVPVLSLVFYSVFILYNVSKTSESRETLEKIRDEYAPLVSLTNENIGLFNQLRERYKDAIVAAEQHWLLEAQALQREIGNNLAVVKTYPHIVDTEQVEALNDSLNAYIRFGETFARRAIQDDNAFLTNDDLLDKVDHYQALSAAGFADMHKHARARFNTSVNGVNLALDRMMFLSSAVAVGLFLFLIIATFFVSYTTYRNVQTVVNRMRALALGNTDFSQRLTHRARDELGYLIHWFNKLSDKLEQSHLELQKVSITDKLTTLNNRNRVDGFLPASIEEARYHSQQLALALLDVDHFKKINDNYGHQAGDMVLIHLAHLMKNQAREHDFIGRWGGEEFIIILQDTGEALAMSLMEALREDVEKASFPGVGRVTISIGVSMLKPGDDAELLLKRADEQLYLAKQQGRNCTRLD